MMHNFVNTAPTMSQKRYYFTQICEGTYLDLTDDPVMFVQVFLTQHTCMSTSLRNIHKDDTSGRRNNHICKGSFRYFVLKAFLFWQYSGTQIAESSLTLDSTQFVPQPKFILYLLRFFPCL